MPQVITGFDKFAQSQRQKKLDERTATLQDAQEARAASAFEMAKQDRVTDRARQVKLDAQAEEAGKLRMQNDVLAVVAGASEQLMQTTSPMPLNGAFAPLTSYLPADLQQQAATVESVFGGDGKPSAFVYKDATGNTVATVGLQDPAAVAMMTGNVKQGSAGEWYSAGTTYDPKTGKWNFIQVEKGSGEKRLTEVGVPAGAVEPNKGPDIGTIVKTSTFAWDTGLANEVTNLIPPGLIDSDFDNTTARDMDLSIRRLMAQNADNPAALKALQTAMLKLREVERRMQGAAPPAGSAPVIDPLSGMGGGGGGDDPLSGVFQ